MDIYQLIQTRRSVRSYSSKEVPDAVLRKVLNAARLAPSARNRQPWRFVVVRDEARRHAVAECCWLPKSPEPQRWIAEAPVVIVCCVAHYGETSSWIGKNMAVIDTAIALDHLTLAARAEDLGTCWVAGGINDASPTPEGLKDNHSRLRELVKTPDNVDVAFVTPIGYPAEGETSFCDTTEKRRLSYDEIVYEEFFSL